ncbi:MAG: hypothetical protein R2831_12165, partial [Chitinophagaceae bacterium]
MQKRIYILLLFLSLTLLSVLPKLGFAEGSSTANPNSSVVTALSILPNQNRGSYLGCNTDSRIRIRIVDNATENIYYGFDWRAYSSTVVTTPAPAITNMYMRIFDPNGTQVAQINLPSSGAGYISGYSDANIGANIAGSAPGGYSPLSYNPSMNGDYWVEFYQSTDGGNTMLSGAAPTGWCFSPYWDIQVATAAGIRHNGRVFCRNWSFNAMHPTLFYTSFDQDAAPEIYAWSTDSNIVKINFTSEFKPIAFNVAVTEYGIVNTGNFANDRKSVNSLLAPSLLNGYNLFVNVPDTTQFPPALPTPAPKLEEPIIVGCSSPFQIRYTTYGAGDVRLLLDLNGVTGYQANSSDRILEAFDVQPGLNTMTWDGLNGLGAPVPSGSTFQMSLSYYKGRFNIPIYDAEINKNGFDIETIAPVADPNIKLYWDDSNLPNVGTFCDATATGALNNTTGSGLDNTFVGTISPCHAWSGDGNVNQIIPAPAVGTNETTNLQCDDFGNVRVINTFGWGTTVFDSATVYFACLQASGTIWNDLDSSANGTNLNIFTSGETGTNMGSPLFVSLVDPITGTVLQSVPVNPDGTYLFTTVPPNTVDLKIIVSTTQGVTGNTPPAENISPLWYATSPLNQNFSSGITNISGLDFGVVEITYAVSGTVFNDANGLSDNTVNGTGLGEPSNTPLYANLLDASGNVVATALVDSATGTYTFPSVLPGNYSVQISSIEGNVGNAAPATDLPFGWFATGENNGAGTGSDGTPNGVSATFTVGTSNVTDINFGIQEAAPNPDINQTWVNVPVTGDVSTNDENSPVGSTYGNPAPNPANPGT